jgi:hypothetical protein
LGRIGSIQAVLVGHIFDMFTFFICGYTKSEVINMPHKPLTPQEKLLIKASTIGIDNSIKIIDNFAQNSVSEKLQAADTENNVDFGKKQIRRVK